MVKRKPGSARINELLDDFRSSKWLRYDERKWWPDFLFHYSDIQNVLSILQDDCLYSRNQLEKKRRDFIDSASSEVLEKTSEEYKSYVRLYFRPLTPTQYYAEGICSETTLAKSRYPDAHCPVPVFFLFNSFDILSRANCKYSNGGLGNWDVQLYSNVEELIKLPWMKIYHTGYFNPNDPSQASISFHRNAEVILPNKLSLKSLKWIYCRSEAEKETLLHILPDKLRKNFQKKIFATTRSMIFYRRQTFIETVNLTEKYVSFHFSPETRSLGPFQFSLRIYDDETDEIIRREITRNANDTLKFTFPRMMPNYSVQLMLDGHLAYSNRFEDIELPF